MGRRATIAFIVGAFLLMTLRWGVEAARGAGAGLPPSGWAPELLRALAGVALAGAAYARLARRRGATPALLLALALLLGSALARAL